MKAYHFTSETLRDGRPIPKVGKWLEHKGSLVPCESGLHASQHPFDALQFAPGNTLHLVELAGEIVPHGDPVDKLCARKRKIVKSMNSEKLLRDFARRVALDVLPLWKDAPGVVEKYFRTGDERLRDSAWAAARVADWSAAWAAARDAARAANWSAAWAAARDAAWYAARASAWASDRAAARAAATKKYRKWFKEMIDAAFKEAK